MYEENIINFFASRIYCNLSLLEEDLIKAQSYEDCSKKVIFRWHAIIYLTLMLSFINAIYDQSLDEEFERIQVISNI